MAGRLRMMIVGIAAMMMTIPIQAATPGTYKAQLAQAMEQGASVDFAALRAAYAREPGYSGYFGIDRGKAFAALDKGDNATALKLAQEAIADAYVDIYAHMVADFAYRSLGQMEQADAERAICRGMIAALMATGDGASRETAYRVLSVPEEYLILQLKGLRPQKQSLITEKGVYDLLETTDPKTGKVVQNWFDISGFFGKGL